MDKKHTHPTMASILNKVSYNRNNTNEEFMVNIFMLCHNEEVVLPHSIDHYRTNFPNCRIFIYDNMSTDRSGEIATEKLCSVTVWNSNEEVDDEQFMAFKRFIWRSVPQNEWIIVCDVDEWLCITESQLREEDKHGTTVLNVKGFQMMAKSECDDLSDIEDIHNLSRAMTNHTWESKKLCFKKGPIKGMTYKLGAHSCDIIGNAVFSEFNYINKHMETLGIPYLERRCFPRRKRCKNKTPAHGNYPDTHEGIMNKYSSWDKKSVNIDPSKIYRSHDLK